MVFGILKMSGTTQDSDILYAIESMVDQKAKLIWHKSVDFSDVDVLIITDGVKKANSLVSIIQEFITKDKIIIGIGKGFTFLCEYGFLPGNLFLNDNGKFIGKNIYVSIENKNTVLTKGIEMETPLLLPFASKQGRYSASSEKLEELAKNNQVVFKLAPPKNCCDTGHTKIGSDNSIAGICNKEKNVFGISFHPERAADDELGNTDGRLVFEALIQNLTKQLTT